MRPPHAFPNSTAALRSTFGALATLLALSVAGAASAVTLQPDRLGPPLTASGCDESSNCLLCPTSCDESDQNTANAAILHGVVYPGNPFVNEASSRLWTDFTVAPPAQGEGDWVTGTVYYDAEWKGLWSVVGILTNANQATMDITMSLVDRTDSTPPLVTVPVHETSPKGFGIEIFEVGGWTDHGRAQSSFTTQLRRGHTYRLYFLLKLHTFALSNGYYTLDYKTGGWGAWWNELRVALGPDPHEIAANLQAQVDTLKYRLEHHGHEYLTGRGEGHNNTVATTSATIFFDDAGDTTGTTNVGTGSADAAPVSVILHSNYPNPARRETMFAFTLSAPAQVTIRLFNARGQLVETLADGWMDAGEQRIPIDVGRLAAGVYFYRLTAGPFRESRRLVVK